MNFNLLRNAWIPVRLQDGTRKEIRPVDILPTSENPAVELNGPRPDFNGALAQFLIGLFQTFGAPKTEDDWWDVYESPSTQDFEAKFQAIEEAFELFGSPRFLQDIDELPRRFEAEIFDLLLESPGAKTKNDNKDFFIKREIDFHTCPHCAALSVLTMQLNSPGGGPGFRTSIRGGGPATTILTSDTLWDLVWLNVLPQSEAPYYAGNLSQEDLPKALPWLADARTSEKKTGQDTCLEDMHPAQYFWATPRRLELEAPLASDVACSICGKSRGHVISSYYQKNYGTNYSGPLVHPLSPYTFNDKNEPNPLKGSQEGFAYKHWQGIVATHEKANRKPAEVVSYFRRERAVEFQTDFADKQIRVWAFGFDADNAKIRGWQEGLMPLVLIDPDHRVLLDNFGRHLISGAESARYALNTALKRGVFGTLKDVSAKGKRNWRIDDRADNSKGLLWQGTLQFWRDTEEAFFEMLQDVVPHLDSRDHRQGLKRQWLDVLQKSCLHLYDQLTGYGNFHNANPKSQALARQELKWAFHPEKGFLLKDLFLDPIKKNDYTPNANPTPQGAR